MRSAVLAAVLLLAVVAPAVAAPVQFVPASPRNYAHGYRSAAAIRLVVVHVIEGTAPGAVSWFRNPRARASAHYVVGREGDVTQMVSERQVAWHAGNGWVNRHSIGVEDEGYTGIPWTFTDAEYRGSAQLVGSILRHYVLPIDRRHVIGHNEVPDPNHPGEFGGYAHHTDPGRFWDWPRYMAYVRAYATGTTPPPLPFDVDFGGFGLVQTLSGTQRIEAMTSGEPAARVDFLLDGKLRESVAQAPYVLAGGAWDTTAEANGRHRLTAHAVAPDGRVADETILVDISNAPLKVTSLNLTDAQTVGGVFRVQVTTSRPVQRVELLVDGQLRASTSTAPYAIDWDTTKETQDMWHNVSVRAVVRGYAVAARTAFVYVSQLPSQP